MNATGDHISVCICTFKRPKLLTRLLRQLQNQITDHIFTYSVVVVDNDHSESAKKIVTSFKDRSLVSIDYYNEPEQNIALARNKATENAKGNLVAFIDDDEIPVNNWLYNLYKIYNKYKADGVLGPVKPHFEIEPPQWILKGKILERNSFETGTILRSHRHMRTGNVLLSRRIFEDKGSLFDPRYGRTGGEDSDFFKRMIERGCTFVWCNEAYVYEMVPPERFRRTYFLNRALLRGAVSSKRDAFNIQSMLKSVVAITLYTSSLPFFLIICRHLFMKYLIKDCNHIGRLLALCGIEIVREKNF